MRPPHIRWLTRYGPEGASSRYRVYQYLDQPELQEFEHSTSALATWRGQRHELAIGVARRLRSVLGTSNADVTVVQKELVMPPSAWQLGQRIERLGARVIWDVDDAVWLGSSSARKAASSMARRATVVVAGNDEIAAWARSAGSTNVVVIPTCFAGADSVPATPAQHTDKIQMVWIGSPATTNLLDERTEWLLDLMTSNESIHVELLGAGPGTRLALHPRVESTQWTVDNEAAALARADFGLALQPRSPYNDHKCGFKIIKYMAAGVVPVATSNPVHAAIVGANGLLLDDAAPRPTMAQADRLGRRPTHAERLAVQQAWRNQYSTTVGARQWRSVIDEVLG